MKSSGFTLIELIVVIILLSIITSIAAPHFGSFYKGVKFDATIRRIRNFFYYAEFLALKEKTLCKVKIDQKENIFYLLVNRKGKFVPAEMGMGKLILPMGIKLKQVSIDGHLCESYKVEWNVYPLFVPHALSLWIKGLGDRQAIIEVSAGGGLIEVKRGENKRPF